MSEPSLQAHEHDVERARAKLAGSLATLRNPTTLSSFTADLKHEALETKDHLVGQAKAAAQSTLNGFVEDLKAKAAANPAAVVAIGTGLAWRFLRHPPITSALVGMGLYSLWRTNAVRAGAGYQPDYLQEGKERLKEQAAAALSKVKDIATDAQQAVAAKAADLTEAATDKVQQWTADTREHVEALGSSLKAAAPPLAPELHSAGYAAQSYVREQAQNASNMAEDLFNDPASRDKLLLGVAGVAVAAALGIACQKRLAETP